jgi:hypothetical protein
MTQPTLKIVTLLKSGPAWLPEYVYRLSRALERNLTIPYEFVCLTDVPLEVNTLPLLPIPEIDNTNIPKFWYKLQLFRKDLDLTHGCVFLDLDTIIKSNIDYYIDAFQGHDFLMASSPYRGEISCSYLMWWQGDYSNIWDKFCEQSVHHWNTHYHKLNPGKYGDQGFISDHVDHKLIQPTLNISDIVRVTRGESSEISKLLVFAGKRKPWDMSQHPDVVKHWI